MTEYEITTLSVIVKPKGEPIYSERATIIEMSDEAAGIFLTLRQIDDETERGEIKVDLEEWPTIQEAIGLMLIECFDQQNTTK
jgi:hypothetical protein